MRKTLVVCAAVLCMALGMGRVMAEEATSAAESTYNFGDFRSSTLTTKAWGALNSRDLKAVIAYTDKCLELYAEDARKMQDDLSDYPAGDRQKIFSYWALNDVATSLYIQGEAYRQAGKNEEAITVFSRIASEFQYGQAYDPASKSFWKPAEAAKEKLIAIEAGLDLDFGDMSSSFLAKQAWGALAANKIPEVKAYVEKMNSLYGKTAIDMQKTMKEFAWESKEKIFSYWALNDLGTAYFILAEAYRQADKLDEAIETYQKVIDDFGFAQCWDAQGWFWKPAEAAEQKIIEIEATRD